jgi:aminoglycoside phosphotransferase (APT) family kinase protein
LVAGQPATDRDLTAEDGRRVGEFLRALHDMPVSVYVESGIPDRVAARSELLATLDRLLHRVLPLTAEEVHEPGRELLRRVALSTPTALIHGDLGAHHLLVDDDCLVGVIDWSDARVADPAVDLGWALYETPEPFAEAVATAYGVDDDELSRALDWHRLAPWYDVLWGQSAGGPAFVESGLAGITARLTT